MEPPEEAALVGDKLEPFGADALGPAGDVLDFEAGKGKGLERRAELAEKRVSTRRGIQRASDDQRRTQDFDHGSAKRPRHGAPGRSAHAETDRADRGLSRPAAPTEGASRRTRDQLDRLETCLGYFDESPSLLRDTILGAVGNLAAAAHTPAEDEILKNAFANNAFENYEIAAYKSLLALSTRANADIEPQLRQSLAEEQAMAAWIDGHIREITLRFVNCQDRAWRSGWGGRADFRPTRAN